MLSARREKINRGKAERLCRVDDMLRECAPDAPLPVRRSNENSGEPRRVIWPRVHLMVDEHGRTE